MAAERTNTQKLITLHVDGRLFEAAEKCRRGSPRSQWIRDAILEKLQREGIEIPDEAAFAPDRSGKGGPKPKKVVEMPPTQKVAEEHDGSPSVSERKKVKYPKKKGR
ncbi:hypothetical protein [Luteolibacter marinus]|uniref:hypothetical protein n=1 Tax=Luteolibacter marinus TaxID=2776705 RepID=UPI0018665B1A|nr:hypothetical protein [Luteolibacter marinus]